MRLGFWNRLSIVATALVTVGLPTYLFIDYANDAEQRRMAWRDLCFEWSERKDMQPSKTRDECWQEYFDTPTLPEADLWWQGAGVALIVCAIAYLLIWGITATAKWVWRGRKIGSM